MRRAYKDTRVNCCGCGGGPLRDYLQGPELYATALHKHIVRRLLEWLVGLRNVRLENWSAAPQQAADCSDMLDGPTPFSGRTHLFSATCSL